MSYLVKHGGEAFLFEMLKTVPIWGAGMIVIVSI